MTPVSFSLSVSGVDPFSVRSAVLVELERQLAENRVDGVLTGYLAEVESEFRDAVEGGIRMAEFGVNLVGQGRPDWSVNVSISGHVNPGGVPREGWANDFVSVSVSNASVGPVERARLDALAEAADAASVEAEPEEPVVVDEPEAEVVMMDDPVLLAHLAESDSGGGEALVPPTADGAVVADLTGD